ncbi:hypothetical protein A3C87_01290 [Candidatus Kaiserbacteria bacterium RIFCSPHIGHO2_02_FULL_49_34]|uniref:Bacterial type II secretion system protein E domain-containing protein n=1 Tax=Candidatus Kaiserbacteria bacterium RIFCSPHIGHO2_02_FULL_49_34 TaxID=1798491 RepID=A0A1F6DLJ4_9BACT|nr:MAG: hypothetical protein A3C87_01290 [Candidatus Kaiserbacteria bacterium RIFCSPHIGHO2_02_FULL_49_34]
MIQFDDERVAGKLASLRHDEVEERVRMLAAQIGTNYINLVGISINPEALSQIPEAQAKELEMVAFLLHGTTLSIAMKNPKNPRAQEVVTTLKKKGYVVKEYMVSEASLQHVYLRYADLRSATASSKHSLDIDAELVASLSERIRSHLDVDTMMQEAFAMESSEKISRIVSIMFAGANALRSSDIHIEPEEDTTRMRYRIDGVLWEVTNLPPTIYHGVMQRIKLLAGAKLNVHNEAQDGRMSFVLGAATIDVRVSIIPGGHGESVVMRLLNSESAQLSLEDLGFSEILRNVIEEELARPNGAIITTGPTGSGKTTALYAFLIAVHKPGVKIITIEDPIEYRLPGIVQTQTGAHYTFASGLRAILRQDPDIIMVGEMRDLEVSETVVHAALTGHLVFSTLHTNSAIGAIPRLIDMGIEPTILGSSFNLMLGQRLARRLCPHCKKARTATPDEQKIMMRVLGTAPASTQIYDAVGCDKCGMSGYKGRIGIYEAVRMTHDLAPHIKKGISEEEISERIKPQGIPSMQQDGVMKVLAGVTSLDELERVVDLHGT